MGPGGDDNSFLRRWGPILLVLLLFLVPWIFPFFLGLGQTNTISYSQFKQELANGNVQSVTIQGERIRGVLRGGGQGTSGQGEQQFITYIPAKASNELLNQLEGQEVQVNTQPEQDGGFFQVLLNILPFAIMIWIFWRLYKGMQSRGQGMFNVGKSKAKEHKSQSVETRFDDVAGIESAKYELQEIVSFLKDPDKYKKFGAKSPKGVLLVGPPGTGKTLLARAVAGEADVPFFSISGSDFMEMFVGVGASRVRNLFKDAKKQQPSIIFIDELDSIGRKRGAGLGGGHDEREQTLNQLLSELDGFEQDESTIVLGATNRPDILDQALLRPGRFDRRVTTNLPPTRDRMKILKIHAKAKPVSDSVDYEELAQSTPGFSGADLANLLNEAALIAASKDKEQVEEEDIYQAHDKILLGLKRQGLVLTKEEKRVLSYHETGHAVVAAGLPHTDPVHKVTIVPRQQSMGVTQQLPEKDKYIYDKEYIQSRLAVMMGGRAAEHLKLNTETSGAENDLKQAQQIARRMVLDWGMSEALQNVALGSERRNVFLGEELSSRKEYSDETSRIIDKEVKRILNEAFDLATKTLKEYGEKVDQVADELLNEEEIPGERVYEILGIQRDRREDEDLAEADEAETEEAESAN
jgi:cell division protease FtsH